MTLSLRPYEDGDLELLQKCIMDWRKQYPDGTYCHPGDIPHRLYNGNRGKFSLVDITRIYRQGDTVAALLLAYPRYESMDIFIHPDFREQHDLFVPVIDAGYQIVREYLIQNDKADKAVVMDCFRGDASRQSLLTLTGFSEGENDMNLTRRKLENLPEIQLPEGFTIRSATIDDVEQLENVHNRSFTPSWTTDIYRNEVMLKPGYKPEREFVVIAPDGTFAGFCVTWLDETNKVGLFEPVGTHEDYQRQGLAKALMTQVMHMMKAEGMVEAEVCYGINNLPAKKLYTGLGFEPKHHIYEWKRVPKGEQS